MKDFRAVDCVFRTGYRCYNRNVYSNSEAQDSPALPGRCHGTIVEQRERSSSKNERQCRDWQPADLGRRTMQTMRGRNVQDRQVEGQNTKNKEYEVIGEMER